MSDGADADADARWGWGPGDLEIEGEDGEFVPLHGEATGAAGDDKLSKSEVRYEHPARGLDRCGGCVHFLEPNACELVAGAIAPEDWCELYEART